MRVRNLISLIIALIFVAGCVGPLRRPPRSISGLAKEYVVLQGKLASAPQVKEGGEVLEIYFGVGEKDPPPPRILVDEETGQEIQVSDTLDPAERFEDVKYCVAFNNDEKNRLKDAADLMVSSDKTVFLYAKMIEGRKFKWWYDGLDCVVFAVGAYKPEIYKYVTLDTAYGLSWKDSFSFKSLMRSAVKEGGKTVMKVIPLP